MVLSDLRRGDRAVVLEVGGRFRQALAVLGVYAGAKIAVLRVSPRGHTFLIQADGKTILAREAAREVRVCKM